jgi:tetratricopeptide (TPR) repeat protein
MNKLSRHPWLNLLALALCLALGSGCTKASKVRRHLASAERDYQAKKYDDAEIEYRSVRLLSPADPLAIRRLGLIYFEEGRPREALLYLKRAIELEPKNPDVQLKLAEIYGGMGKLKEAVDLLGAALRSDPGNEHALLLLAQFSRTNDLPALAQRMQTQLREGGSGAAACHSALGWIALRMQKTNDANLEFQKASALDPKLASPYLGRVVLCSVLKDTNGVEQALKTAAELSPVRSAVRLRYAELRMRSGAPEDAKTMLSDLTRQAPDYLPAWLELMKVYFAEHKYDECKSTIDRILARDNVNYDAMMQLGTLYLVQRKAPQALSVFQRLDQYHKNIPQVKFQLALAHLINNEKQKAMTDLSDALALDRNYSSAALLLAELYFRSGRLTEAVTLFSQLSKNHPENAQAQLMLAETYLAQERPDRALEVYQRMGQIFGKNAEIPRRMGLVYLQQGDTARARAAFEKSLGLAPDFLPTLQQITELDISEQRFAEAQRRVAAVIEKNPKAAEPVVLQGEVYWAERKTNQAEATFSKAIELNPELPGAYLKLAGFYLATHQEQQALKRLASLLDKTNDQSAMLEIGEIHQAAGRFDQARDAYQKLLAVNPKSIPALNNLAYLESQYLGKLDHALELAETASNFRPDDANSADTLGWILFKKHQYAHALNLIRESSDKQPNNAEVQMHLGMAYYMMEEEKPAAIYLQRALASRADYPDKELARRCLDVLNMDPATANPATIQKLQSLSRDNPQDPVLLSRLASIQELHGEVEKAAETLHALIDISPDDWQAMLRLSRLYAGRLNDPRKALDLAKSAHNLAPDDGRASALLGELVFRSGDYRWALSLLEQAVNKTPDQPSLFYHLALAYYAMGRVADADAAMQKAIDPRTPQPDIDQAKQFMALRAAVKDPAQARASDPLAQKVLQQDPNSVPALMVSELLAERRGAVEEATQACRKVLSIYPLFAPAMRQLAILYSHSQRAGDLDQAYDFAEKARTAMPDDLELAKTLGLLAYHRADYNRSLPLLQDCAQKSANDAELLYYLGMDYYQLKQRSQCKQALQRALDLRVPDILASNARSILKDLK